MVKIPEVESLGLEERIGQTLCFGWQAATAEESRSFNAHARALIEDMRVGGIVLMGRNVAPPDQARALFGALQAFSPIPLFIAVDQEGGMVNRFRAPLHEFSGNMALGAIAHGAEDLARRQAEAQARELLALGVNWDLAPVLDVNNNPDNPIIGVRSYGEDPKRVARLGASAIEGFESVGMMACAKHFPGHGDTAADSHLALPRVPGDRARLEAVELVPFRAAIEAGVSAMMTTHIVFPTLDSERPATLSPAILTGLLRQEMGFAGLIVTDCLEMDAIRKTVGTARAAVESLRAGADMVLICHTLSTQRASVAAIKNAVETGELSEERLNEAAERVLAAKRRYLPSAPQPTGAAWTDPEHYRLELEIARASITVVRRARNPFIEREDRAVVISAHPIVDSLAEGVARRLPDGYCRSMRIGAAWPQRQARDAVEVAKASNCAIVATAPPEPWAEQHIDQEKQAAFVRELQGAVGDRLVVLALRDPYDIRRFPAVRNYLCGYGYRPATIEALADALVGAYEPTGRLPVTIPGCES